MVRLRTRAWPLVRSLVVLSTAGGACALAAAFATASAQRGSLPPIRDIGPVLARATDSIGAIMQVVVLPRGRVAINDSKKRHVIILDSSLSREIIVLDTATGAQHAYGTGGQILAYRGDSLLFAEPGSLGMLVIGADGHIGRSIAFPPGPNSAGNLPRRIDPRGRLVFQTMGANAARAGPGGVCKDSAGAQDSVTLLRADLQTRTVERIGFMRHDRAPCPLRMSPVPGAALVQTPVVPVYARSDGWGMLADGTVALVRENYSIDWIDLDGGHRSSPPVAAEWHRLSDSDKVVVVDSLRAYNAAHSNSSVLMADGTRRPYAFGVQDPQFVVDYAAAFVGSFPPVSDGQLIGDSDGSLWIREASAHLAYQPPLVDSPVYDVVDRNGTLVDRVRIPAGATLVGFGPGVAYLTSREGAGVSFVRVRIR